MFLRLLIVSALAGSAIGCTATKVTGEIRGEPVCEDFELGGGTKMKGSLRQPVQITILEDDEPLWERVVFGRRNADDKATVFAITDEDEEYTVRWAQCPNAFAPKPIGEALRTTDRAGSYSCGEAKVYQDTKLVIKEGDPGSRVIEWQAPPEARCWGSEDTASASSASAATASAPAPEPTAAASAAPAAEPSAAPSATASTSSAPPPATSAAPAGDPKAPKTAEP